MQLKLRWHVWHAHQWCVRKRYTYRTHVNPWTALPSLWTDQTVKSLKPNGIDIRFTRFRNLLSAQSDMIRVLQKVLQGIVESAWENKAKQVLTSNMVIARCNNGRSNSPARVSASMHLGGNFGVRQQQSLNHETYHNVHKQNVPSSPPTPSSLLVTS